MVTRGGRRDRWRAQEGSFISSALTAQKDTLSECKGMFVVKTASDEHKPILRPDPCEPKRGPRDGTASRPEAEQTSSSEVKQETVVAKNKGLS